MSIRVIGYDNWKLYNLDKALGGLKQDMSGLNKPSFRGQTVAERVGSGTSAGLMELGLKIERDAKRKTPVDTGKLKNSGYSKPSGTWANPKVEVGFSADYALYVHEDLEVNHRNGEARFLVKAVAENMGDHQKIFVKNIGAHIRPALRGTAYGVPYSSFSSTAGTEARASGFIGGIGAG